jgi:transposase
MGEQVRRVVIGMDPRTVTIEVMTADERVVGGGRFDTTVEGYAAMLEHVAVWPERVWAIEGCEGIGRHIAHRLIADGQDVVDVPAKLSARARVFATGQGRKTDATDAHSVALVGTRMAGLRPVVTDVPLEVLQLLVDRRRWIGDEHTRKVSQLHRILLKCCLVARRSTSPPLRGRPCWPGSDRVMRSAGPANASPRSSSLTWSGSTRGRRPPTRS